MSDRQRVMAFGSELRRCRLAAGLSLSGLALRVHYSKSHLSKVERGRKTPSNDLARRCDAALGANGRLASLVSTAQTANPALPAGPVDDHWIISIDGDGRGAFGAVTRPNRATAGAVGPLTWTLPVINGVRNGTSELEPFRTMFDEVRRLGQAMAPAALLPVLITQTHALRLLAITGRARTRARALLLAGRFAEYTGWMAQEAGDDQGALWWTDRAVDFAAAGGDQQLAAYALVRRGLVAMYRDDAQETIATAVRAQGARCSARIRGLASLREAQGRALAGDYNGCCRALDRAAALLSDSSDMDDDLPVLGTTTVHDPVVMVTGWCMYDLGRPHRALDLLDRALAAVPDYAHRTLARIGVRYSLALVAAGEVEHACTMLDRLLNTVILVDSATIRSDLRQLARELNRRHQQRAVRAIMPRLTDALRTAY